MKTSKKLYNTALILKISKNILAGLIVYFF